MKQFILLAFLSISLFANNSELLTQTKQEIIELKKEQIKQKEKTNKYDWVGDINLNGTVSINQDDIKSEDYSISLSQDIFKFGGIYSQVKYAKELKKLEELNLNITTKEDIKLLYTYVIDIRLDEISIKQNILNIKNSQIDIEHKKSEYKAGELGISDLNDAIITKNNLRTTQKSLLLSKQQNINSLKMYTEKQYSAIKMPNMKLIEKDTFLENAIALKSATLSVNVNNLSYDIKKSSYLPSLSFDTKLGYANSDNTIGEDYYSYGLKVFVPLSFISSSDIQQSKLDYLISKKEYAKKLNTIELNYDEIILQIQSNKEKIELAFEDIQLYDELLGVNEEEYKAGYKTIDDINSLKNSMQIRKLDIKSYKINIQKELLKLYFMI